MEDEEIKIITDYVDKTLKDNYVKNMFEGFDICNQMILDYINKGHTLEEVKQFCETNKKNRKKNIKIAQNK